MMNRKTLAALVLLASSQSIGQWVSAQPGFPAGPSPTHANIAYAEPDPAESQGHLLDLFLVEEAVEPTPVVIWTSGSAWFADNGKIGAGFYAEQLNMAGYAVAGVSVRSSAQVQFPGQLHDIKAAIRWLRLNATEYGLDQDRIAIMGDSSGGWTSAIAAVTGDVPDLEGSVGETGVSSAVQAAVAFFPPTNFLEMDKWALERCDAGAPMGPGVAFCHDEATSPESLLIGCAIQTCPEKVQQANPINYISEADPPIMILHGNSDPLVPHSQGEMLYQALNKACHDSVFISLPTAGHGPSVGFLTDDGIREHAIMRSTQAEGCIAANPVPYQPDWTTIIDFLGASMN